MESFTVRLHDDGVAESSETFTASTSNPVNALPYFFNTGTQTITDDANPAYSVGSPLTTPDPGPARSARPCSA